MRMSSKLFSASDFATAVLWPIVSAMLVAEQLPTKVDRPFGLFLFFECAE